MKISTRTTLMLLLIVILISIFANQAQAARRRAVLALPAPGVVTVASPVGVVAAPAVVPMPLGSLAAVHDFPGGVAYYGGAYRVATPVMGPAKPPVVRYGRREFVGPRGYAAVVSPWPLIPSTTPSQPYGVGVVPPGQVVAWQSPGGYLYRANYQSAVMQGGLSTTCPQPAGIDGDAVEMVPPSELEVPLESIPAPPAEIGPQL